MKPQKFEAIGKEIMIPDNCNFVDLGESIIFLGTITDFLEEKFSLAAVLDFLEKYPIGGLNRPNGQCVFQSCADGQDYIMIVYHPKEDLRAAKGVDSEFNYWRVRGHEECHALLEMGLKDEVDKIIGRPYDNGDLEAVCDLAGLYAADIRGLEHLIAPEKRAYFERAVRWEQYRREAEETHKQALAKKGETAVLSVDQIIEMRKRLEEM